MHMSPVCIQLFCGLFLPLELLNFVHIYTNFKSSEILMYFFTFWPFTCDALKLLYLDLLNWYVGMYS